MQNYFKEYKLLHNEKFNWKNMEMSMSRNVATAVSDLELSAKG